MKTPGFSSNLTSAHAQGCEEFILVTRAGDLGVRGAGRCEHMSVAAADPDFVPLVCEACGVDILFREHVAVPRLNGGEILFKPAEVVPLTRPGKTREHVIDAEEELPLAQVHEQSDEIVASLLKLNMLPLGDVVNADMRERTAGHEAGNLFADEEVSMPAQRFRAFNRIVVGQCEQIHAALAQRREYGFGSAIAFAANTADNGHGAKAGMIGVDMQVALHDFQRRTTTLSVDDSRDKVMKQKEFNSFGTVTEF